MVDRFLSFMSIDDRATQESKLFYFQLVLLLTTAVHQVDHGLQYVVPILGCALLGLKARYGRLAALGALSYCYHGTCLISLRSPTIHSSKQS